MITGSNLSVKEYVPVPDDDYRKYDTKSMAVLHEVRRIRRQRFEYKKMRRKMADASRRRNRD